ncbi:RNA 2',3'-cyclic phosphodiesterase [Halobacillus sp. Cin3]|uniref:RNA 2',3'-cyclic phosphodiesterase n=1 Tax=Halobacillus sp. Cin3 TaxID=2928441 RepID=UPI00248EBABF|nr:RNA 2',3'-cyclic phosphodiesterase [Halobacillus sp. Cin3]
MSDPHYFIGLKTEQAADHLLLWQQELREHMQYKVWTNPSDFHVTLKFLGPASDEKINKLITILHQQELPDAFSITIGPAGGFGHPQSPRVFLAEVEKAPQLEKLYQQVEKAAAASGWDRERRKFHPHITLAKKQAEGQSPLSLSNVPPVFQQKFPMIMDHVTLFRIHPGEHPKYQEVFTIELKSRDGNGSTN